MLHSCNYVFFLFISPTIKLRLGKSLRERLDRGLAKNSIDLMYKNIYFREMQINFMYCNYYIVPENSLKLLSCGKLEKNLINIEILFCDVLCRLT